MSKIAVNDIRMKVVDRGEGPVVLLVHGFPLDHTMWNAQIEFLSASHRVLAVDLRGFGQSELGELAVSISQYANDLVELLEGLSIDQPVTFCGLSMGGYVAFEFLRQAPQRLHSLVLCDTRAGADSPEARANRQTLAASVLREGPAKLADGMRTKLFAEATLARKDSVVDQTVKVMLETEPKSIAAALVAMAERPDSTDLLAKIPVPTLFIVGEDDAITSADEMRSMSEAVPGAELVVVPSAGHMAPTEQPDVVNEAMGRFLS